jgi:hypothetical protein
VRRGLFTPPRLTVGGGLLLAVSPSIGVVGGYSAFVLAGLLGFVAMIVGGILWTIAAIRGSGAEPEPEP